MNKKYINIKRMLILPMILLLISAYPIQALATDPSQSIWSSNTSSKVIALTFDDCGDAASLTAIIQILKTNNIKATFFPTGKNALANATLIKQAFDNGNQIANHTYDHTSLVTLTSAQIQDELIKADAAIKNITGKSTQPYFRAPYYDYNSTVLQAAGDAGYSKAIMCDVNTGDWSGISASQITQTVLNNAGPGSIVGMHAGSGAVNTPDALPAIISSLKAKGYSFVTISQLVPEDPSQVISKVNTNSKVIALTFDNCWNAANLSSIIQVLKANNVKGTFFTIGAAAEANSTLIKQAFDNGNEIGNNSYTHPEFTTLTSAQMQNELNSADTVIKGIIGQTPRPYFKPPYGDYNSAVLQAAGNAGYSKTITWTIDTADSTGASATSITQKVLSNAVPGAIVEMNANGGAVNTPAALSTMISGLKAQGYTFVTVSQLLTYQNKFVTINPSQVISKVNTSSKVIALTFDDCWNAANLSSIIQILKANNVKGTFFAIGQAAEANSALIKQAYANGNEIGNHSYTHPSLILLTPAQVKDEVNKADAAIINITGQSTQPYFRPPYADYNSMVLQAVADAGYSKTILWTIDTADSTGTSAAAMIQKVVNNAVPGAIVEMHANKGAVNTPAALTTIISSLKAQGYQFVTISELLKY
jgi:peptidoglycan/xylan/chitin deacetylase (PgdA/CDA1 family)